MRPVSRMPPRRPYFAGPRPTVPVLTRAAQYVRKSTDRQQYSIENQKQVIAEYALCHDIEIVRTYADAGRSGLQIEGRDALKQLIYDVQNGSADFKTILVYDVSRWGRFQDADESAYYEFICKAAGISVEYCAEQFENNGSVVATLLKGMKRAMAGEYSRELSVKITQAHRRYAQLGFHQGGSPNYGLRRVLVDESGEPKLSLRDGQEKSLHSDRVILVPGPANEVRIVRDIYRLYVDKRMSHKRIARLLNQRGLRNGRGNSWSNYNIREILGNEKYAGTFVYGRTSYKLLSDRIHLPREQWIRARGAIQPIIDGETFSAAQRLLDEPWAFNDNELLDHLTAAWCASGYLSSLVINQAKCAPCATAYLERFGSIANAYRIIGYKTVHNYRYAGIADFLRRIHRETVCRLISDVEKRGGSVLFDEGSQCLKVNGTFIVSIVVIPYLIPKKGELPGWTLRFDCLPKGDVILVVRMKKLNEDVSDYHLFPFGWLPKPRFRFTDENISQFRPYRLASLSRFFTFCRKEYLKTPA